ncbi:GUN4 domain-containing protein [Okeania sp.]|uniref:GUN4 domain-containing protein n=1 Tax=Okeania sp. TaxID=3100323 RepID=UPI002B4B83C5|nr:GUN4 domain-containing protein [Okeania sp.]MEB3340406.1 GUN4 domain-containing protein [Okeania sp.]
MEAEDNNFFLLFANLDNYLEQQKWQYANDETEKILMEIYDVEDIEEMSVEIKTLDKLWLKYSNNHFGFSIHKQIISANKLNQVNQENLWQVGIICKLADYVGWCKEGVWLNYPSQYTFNLDAPLGHLPTFWGIDTFIDNEGYGGFFILVSDFYFELLSQI